jgi:hypothetical protein
VNELPSMEEFEKLVAESFQSELIPAETAAQPEEARADNGQPASADAPRVAGAQPDSEVPEERVEETEKAG